MAPAPISLYATATTHLGSPWALEAIAMCVTWCGSAVARDSLDAGPLAIIAPLLDAVGLEEVLRTHLSQGPRQEFADSQVLTALLAARLCQPTALMNVAAWAATTGAEHFFGVPAAKLNDDRVGRALDHFFEHRYAIQCSLVAKVVADFQIPLDRLHFDTTHITFTGAYDSSRPRPADTLLPPHTPEAVFPPAHITYG